MRRTHFLAVTSQLLLRLQWCFSGLRRHGVFSSRSLRLASPPDVLSDDITMSSMLERRSWYRQPYLQSWLYEARRSSRCSLFPFTSKIVETIIWCELGIGAIRRY